MDGNYNDDKEYLVLIAFADALLAASKVLRRSAPLSRGKLGIQQRPAALPIAAREVTLDGPSNAGRTGSPIRLLYRVEEAAEVLGLGKSTIYKLLASGELKSVKVGRSCRIAAQELLEFIGGEDV